MGRYTGNVCKLCRREGMALWLKGQRCFSEKCSLKKRDYPPGQHTRRPRKVSEYNRQLREKQKAKRIYGIQETQFLKYFRLAERMKGNTGENLLTILERRLDNVVLALGLALSRYHARQLVSHGHVTVNGKRLNIPSYLVRVGDEIGITRKEKIRKLVAETVEINRGTEVPSWLEADPTNLSGKVVQLPKRDDVTHDLHEQLIVELCSK